MYSKPAFCLLKAILWCTEGHTIFSAGAGRLRRLCCVPYATFYMLSYVLVLAEVILIIMRTEGLARQPAPAPPLSPPILGNSSRLPAILGLSLLEKKTGQ